MKQDFVKRSLFSPLVAGVLAEIGYAVVIGAIGILACVAALLVSEVL